MATFGVCMVKDEADVIAGTLRHMADEVDHLIVADNGSTDGTRDLLAALEDDLPLTVLDDPDTAYYQSKKVTALAHMAGDQGAEWIVPFDADELWVSHGRRIREDLAAAGPTVVVMAASLHNHFASAVDPDDPDPFRSIVWRQRHQGALPKVAFRYHPAAVVHQGNHGVDHPLGNMPTYGPLAIRHFPYRSAKQFIRKARNGAAAYKATDLPPEVGAHWRQYGDLLDRYGEETLAEVYREHFWFLSPVDSGMVLDPAPFLRWQP